MSGTRRIGGNLLLLAVGTGLGLALLEVGARVVLSKRRPGGTGEQALYTMGDPVLGWRNRPGATLTFRRREYETKVLINRLGFRDIERTVARPADRPRVLILGDSFIEAYAVERDEGVTRRIEALANEAGCPVDVVNAGVHAYSIDQEFLWYQRESAAMAPDLVVMAVYYNDIINTVRGNYWGSPKPVLELRGGDLVPVNTPLPVPPDSSLTMAVAPRAARPIAGSALRKIVLERLLAGAPRFYERLAGLGLVERYGTVAVADELRVYKVKGELLEIDEAWKRTRDIVDAFVRIARERKATPVLAYVPARFEVVDADWDLTKLQYSMNPSAWDRFVVARKLTRLAVQAGLPLLDFTDDLRAATGLLKGSPYFQYDGHWNVRGNDIAARSTVNFLRNRRLLPCGI